MDELRRILLIDDDPGVEEDVIDSFKAEGVEIAFCQTKDDALRQIDSGWRFDLVLLDWYLEQEDDSSLSQLVLVHLSKKFFVPVFVWSNHIPDFTEKLNAGRIPYPRSLTRGISKSEFTPANVKERVKDLYEKSTAARISKIYRDVIGTELESVFFDLADVPEGDIAVFLKSIVGSQDDIDWSNDFVLNLVHRRLIGHNEFLKRLKALLHSIPEGAVSKDELARRMIVNKILYYKPQTDHIRCGDVVRVETGDTIRYATIITPDCDIEHANTRFLDVIELRSMSDQGLGLNTDDRRKISKGNHPSYYFFPSVRIDGEYTDFVAVLKSRVFLEETAADNRESFPRASKRLLYSDRFHCSGSIAMMRPVSSLSNPYKSDFLQSVHSHNSRVGTPDIKNLWLPHTG